MATTDDLIEAFCDALDEKLGPDEGFDVRLGQMIGARLRAHEAAMRDQQAAKLLPDYGADSVAARQHCHRSTVYRRVSRANKVARQMPNATNTQQA